MENFDKKFQIFSFQLQHFKIFSHQNLDPDPDSQPRVDPNP